jgi:tRNA G18 (ribose-2'-O)-methylase SpoU
VTVQYVEDPDDPAVAAFRGMRDPVLRDTLGCFVAEGPDVLDEVVRLGLPIISALIDARHPVPPALPADVGILAAGPAVIGRITGLGVHRGVLALVRRPPTRTAAEVVAAASTIVVLEAVENPVNVGLIARSAAALGADALLLDPTSGDPLYRRAVTASRAASLSLPSARTDDAAALVAALGAEGWTTLALTPAADATDLRTLRPGPKVAVVVGSEGPGLRSATLGAAAVRARIPMARGVDSLNVATAAAIALWSVAGRAERNGPGPHGPHGPHGPRSDGAVPSDPAH